MAKKCNLQQCQSSMLELLLFIDKICIEKKINYWIDGGTLLGAVRHKGFIPWDDDIDICLMAADYKTLIKELEEKCALHDFYHLYHHKEALSTWVEYFGDSRILAHKILSTRIDLIPVKSIPNDKNAIANDISLTNIARYFIKGSFKEESKVLEIHKKKYLGDFSNLRERKKVFLKDFYTYLFSHSSVQPDHLFTYSFNDMLVSKSRRFYTFDDIFPIKKVPFEQYQLSAPNQYDSYLKVLYGPNYMTPPPVEKQRPYADMYYFNNLPKKTTISNMEIFLWREGQHFIARSQKHKLLRYKEKLLSFVNFSMNCIRTNAYTFWITHLSFLVKKTFYKSRF